jgi:hypothetical protein
VFGKFEANANYKLLLFPYNLPVGCFDRYLLTTFSNSGKLIDTLLIFGNGYLTKPNDRYPWGESYSIESEIMENLEINVHRKERLEDEYDKIKKGKRRDRKLEYRYSISPEGKFIKKEEILIKDEVSFYE